MDFATMMQLESHGPDTFVGAGPTYPWGGLYGGQIVAQALAAAARTVEPGYRVHSLHAYFIRRGDATEPIRFEVVRARNGRSFVTRTVSVRQAVGTILTMGASFAVDTDGTDRQIVHKPEVPAPEELAPSRWSSMFERRYIPAETPGRVTAWLKMEAPIDDPIGHAGALAFLSDDLPTEAVIGAMQNRPGWSFDEPEEDDDGSFSASLDHAIWFHRAPRADAWMLHDFVSHGFLSSRGLAIGNLFDLDGSHVATVTQEVLVRPKRS